MEEPPQCVSYSVSSFGGIDATPLHGTALAAQDVEVAMVEIDDAAPPHEAAKPALREDAEQPDVPGRAG